MDEKNKELEALEGAPLARVHCPVCGTDTVSIRGRPEPVCPLAAIDHWRIGYERTAAWRKEADELLREARALLEEGAGFARGHDKVVYPEEVDGLVDRLDTFLGERKGNAAPPVCKTCGRARCTLGVHYANGCHGERCDRADAP